MSPPRCFGIKHPDYRSRLTAGDTVLVVAGTYEESIDFKGKAILLTSQDGPEFTFIDGMGINTVVKIEVNRMKVQQVLSSARLKGFGQDL